MHRPAFFLSNDTKHVSVQVPKGGPKLGMFRKGIAVGKPKKLEIKMICLVEDIWMNIYIRQFQYCVFTGFFKKMRLKRKSRHF